MNVVFLDIDGVMVHDGHMVGSNKHSFNEFCPNAVECLKELLLQTDSVIVISSTIRMFYNDLPAMRNALFSHYGLDKHIVASTPFLGNAAKGDEIQAYLDSVRGTDMEVEKFIIIDDSDDMAHLADRLVYCKNRSGFDRVRMLDGLRLLA